jgi:hypothetical protein
MALPAKEALGGYILEEALAYLIRNNGYRLIENASEDPDSLEHGGHGLLVRGRGAKHQADVLGELELPSPFTLPVRLFVEAKHRKGRCNLRDVRNAHGVISDVNEHYGTDHANGYQQPLRRYQYRYSLFSTSGFGPDAQTFGLAQQISLIDLSGPAFHSLRAAVDAAAATLHQHARTAGMTNLSVNQMRRSLRMALGSTEPGADGLVESASRSATELPSDVLFGWATDFAGTLTATGVGEAGLLLGFPTAPFVLVMRPDSTEDLLRYINTHGSDIRIDIWFERRDQPAGDWTISPRTDPDAFTLRFGLPGVLERWLLSAPDVARRRAMAAKTVLLSTISVFVNRRLVRFLFEPVDAASPTVKPHAETDPETEPAPAEEATDARDMSELRRLLERPRRGPEPDAPPFWPHDEAYAQPVIEALTFEEKPPEKRILKRRQLLRGGSEVAWTPEAARELLSRLESGGYRQADVLRTAAGRGGTISRAAVCRIMHRKQTQRLNGITKPIRRIVDDLKRDGRVPQAARPPLTPGYVGGKAVRFVLPSDLVSAIRELSDD